MKHTRMTPLNLLSMALAIGVVSATLLPAAEPEAPPAPRRQGPPRGEGEANNNQRGPRGQQRGPEGRFQPGGGPMMQGRGGMMPPMESILTEEQREKFGQELFANREKNRELNEKFTKLRGEMDQALFAEKIDEGLIRTKSRELMEVEVERSLLRARAFAKIRPSLSDEQLERLKEWRSEMGRGPQGGPGGFGGPGGPGEGQRPGGRRQGPPPGEGGDDVLPPPVPQKRPVAPAK